MTPIKFEEHIKEKLDKRTIKPSVDAWNKLSERLESKNEKQNNKAFWWLGIAASIIGVLLVSSQLFKSEPLEQIIPKVVVTPEVIKQDETNIIAIDRVENFEEASEEIKLKEEKKSTQIIKEAAIIQPNLVKENIAIAKENNKPKLKTESLKPKSSVIENLTFEDQKVKDVVAQIQNLKNNNTIVTDEAIDALLAEAQKEIALKQLYNDTTGVVDANLLLQDVEAELDQSFRNKVFEALKESFGSVKTAIAQRND